MYKQTGSPKEPVPQVPPGVLKFLKEPSPRGAFKASQNLFLAFFTWKALQAFKALQAWKGLQALKALGFLQKASHNLLLAFFTWTAL